MPEGVEVKISAELIKPILHKRRVVDVKVTANGRYASNKPDGWEEFNEALHSQNIRDNGGMQILDVQTKGKFMYWSFTDDWYLFSTFGMTGQWSPESGKHPCFILRHTFDQRTSHTFQMVFNDPRHFGTLKFVHGRQALLEKLDELGWDPLNHGMTTVWSNFIVNTCARSTKPIGQLLMDQGLFAGVGNYIRAEALYLAKVSPWRQCNLMKKEEILVLCQALVDVMNESYKHQGATILTYKDAYGAEGKYSSCFKVYGKKVDPLGNKIVKEKTPEGRAIHWCPAIQV